jgi:U4/U6.U5 tri-snRNP-associated protein 1
VRGTWNEVEVEDLPIDIVALEAPILEEEPDVSSGVAGALRLAVSKGYLEKDESNRPSISNMNHLKAQNYAIEDKNYKYNLKIMQQMF